MSGLKGLGLSADILARLHARDEAAYKELVERVGPELVSFAAQRLQSVEAAQDIVQDVFYHVWQQGEHFEPRGPLVAYLFAAVRNRALDVLKHERIVQRSHDVLTALPSEGVTSPECAVDMQMESTEEVMRVRRILAELTEHQRTAFSLRYDQELTIPEIAKVLGISSKGAERLMTRVRQLLRDRLLGKGRSSK